MDVCNAVSFFKKNMIYTNNHAKEISFSNGNYEEMFFELDDTLNDDYLNAFNALKNSLFKNIPIHKITGFGFQLKDGNVYDDDSFVINIVMDDDELKDRNIMHRYDLKCFLKTNKKIKKMFTKDYIYDFKKFVNHKNSILITSMGFGFSDYSDTVGCYFISNNYFDTINFYNKKTVLPKEIENHVLENKSYHAFGLSINNNNINKLTYYLNSDEYLMSLIMEECGVVK